MVLRLISVGPTDGRDPMIEKCQHDNRADLPTQRWSEPTGASGRVSDSARRHTFIGGSDARTIMGDDEAALLRLWREKRGESEPPDYSRNLLVQLRLVTEPLNRRWYERTTGEVIKDVQSWVRHPVIRWMAATLDGVVESTGAVFETKFMLPWAFSEEAAAAKHMPQVQQPRALGHRVSD